MHNFKDPDADPEGFRKWQAAGFGCAGILVNGKNSFTVGAGTAQHLVRFQRKMGAQWTQEDLLAVIQRELGSGSAGK